MSDTPIDATPETVVPTPPVEQPDGGVPDAGLVDGGGQSSVPADPAPAADPVAVVDVAPAAEPKVVEPPLIPQVAPPSPAFNAAMAWINGLAATAPAANQITFYQYLLNNVDGLQDALKDFK
jgi:hypothetical protein